MNNPEFKIGETVTFKPYDKPIKARVKAISNGRIGNGLFMDGSPDNRVFYELTGIDEPLFTFTSGLSIVESRFYQFINELHEQAMDKLTGDWMRPGEFTDRPEVVRDLLEFGYVECKRVETDSHTGAEVCYYR